MTTHGEGIFLDMPASTGPRSNERGDSARPLKRSTLNSRFNGAALKRARRFAPNRFFSLLETSALQRGRAQTSAEIPVEGTGGRGCAGASTGPRSNERGDKKSSSGFKFSISFASTGPRSNERGDLCGWGELLERIRGLQRGRAQTSAEI